jgi:hypothetical protein
MGVLEDAIREHLDLKRARGADPGEIERLEREALGPVRREPLTGNERPGFPGEHGAHAHSPIEYHDSTAPHWQQDEDFGDHHLDGEQVEVEEVEHQRRRGFLRRTRGHSSAHHEAVTEGAASEWTEHNDPTAGFEVERSELADLAYEETDAEGLHEAAQVAPGPVDDEHFQNSVAAAEGLDEVSPPSGLSDPDYGPPTEVYQAFYAPDADTALPVVDAEADRFAPSPPQAGAQHPILDDLPSDFTETDVAEVHRDDHGGPAQTPDRLAEPVGQLPAPAEPEVKHDIPEPAPQITESESTSALPGDPPPLQFERPPRRPSFTAEPPGPDVSGADPPQPSAGDRYEPLRMFDVEGVVNKEAGEDVLEETPEFLQDTPEHDRLWFEQRPPKDFDFDG